jgi:gliding motility-associated-like protein
MVMTQLYKLIGTLGVLLFFFSANAQLDADFTLSDSTGCGTLQVGFCDNSSTDTGNFITSWSWSLGGAPATIECPSRVFGTPGIYTVCLTVTDNLGNTDSECKSDIIQVFNLPTPDFTGTPTLNCAPSVVTFTDLSASQDGDIEEWLWGLGGSCGTITQTAAQTPSAVCTYMIPDEYTISLTVKDDNGCENTMTKSNYIKVVEAPEVAIAASSTFGCDDPFTVSFLNLSNVTTGVDFEWDFGNSQTYSGQTPPAITYTQEGVYTVSVTGTDVSTGCSDTLILNNYITVGYPIDFAASDIEGCEGTSITFTDNSLNVADNVVWDFGDGMTSTDPNPTHTYMTSGCYYVKLTRTVGGCVNERYLTQCINILAPPSFNTNNDNNSGCSLPHVVNFSSTSTSAESWEWDFGDGTTSTSQNPTHFYTTYGDFDIYITGVNAQGCTDSIFVNTISVLETEAILTNDNIQGCAPLEVTLGESSSSITSITSWYWELATVSNTFISNAENPTFTIVDTGVFDLVLTVTNTLGCSDTEVFSGAIEVGDNPTLNFTATPVESCVEQAITFTDLSENSVDYWYWDFGDGNDSEEQNPVYFYMDTGYYDVNLIAASNGCFTSLTFDDYIHITAPVSKYNVIKFCDDNYKRKFKNNAVGADSIFWDFGTGIPTDTSTLANPEFVYPASGTYTVTQTVFNASTGCSHSRSEEIVVTDPISGFVPAQTTGCAPMTVLLTDNSQDATFYYWSAPGGVLSDPNASSPYISFDTPGAYTGIQLIIKDINNCRDTFITTDVIYVNEVVADIIADPGIGCDPLPVNFLDNSNNLFNSNSSWEWDFGDGVGSSNLENPSYVYNGGGDYNVTLTVTDSWGCTDDVVIGTPINVSAPVAFFESTESEGCTGNPVSFTSLSDGDDLTFFWDFGDFSSSTAEYPEHSYNSGGTYTVCLTVTDQNGCDNTLCLDDYVSISEPTAAFTQDANFASCPPLTVNFQNLSSNGAVEYIWDFGDDSGVSTLENPTHVYTIPGYFEVSLIAINASGCRDTIKFDDLVILDGPEGDYSISIDSSCAPAVVTLVGSSVTNYDYTWDSGNGIVQTSFGAVSNDTVVFTYNSPGIYTPTLSLENATGCFRTLQPIGSIHVSEITPEFAASETLLCDNNEEITFYNLSSSPDNITNVQWQFESGNPATVNTIDAQTSFPGIGSYDVTMIVDNGICKDTITKPDYINIGPSPVADFNMDIISGCEPLQVSFTDMSGISAGTIDSWSWDFGDGTTDSGQNPSHIFSAGSGIEVTLEVTSAEGCTNTFMQTIDVYAANELTVNEDLAICIGETAQLNVGVVGDTIGSSYSWSPATGLSCVNCLNPVANPSDTTTYIFTMTNAGGCTSTAQVTVDVKPSTLPVVQITVDTTICLNTEVQLVADAGAGIYTYEWDTSNSGLDCYSNCSSPNASPSQTTTYTVTVTNDFGCSSTESVTVGVIDDNQDFMGANKIICEGASITLNASIGTNPIWLTTDNLSCINCPDPIASPTSPTYYVAQVTSDNGCIIIDSVLVDIFYPQNFDAGEDQTICNGETVMLSGYGSGVVNWSPSADFNNPDIINPFVTPTETTTYYMTLTNGDCVMTDSLEVEVTESTNIDLTDVTICEGESIELEVIGNADQFQWNEDPTLSNPTLSNPIVSPIDTTTYTLVAALGTCYPDTATVVVNVIPSPVVSLIESSYYFPGQSIQVEADVEGNGFYGYNWFPNLNISCVTCNNPEITPNDSTMYYFQVTDFSTGCVSIDSIDFIKMETCPAELIGVPNAFTPNGDGVNDRMEVFLSRNMIDGGIVSFRIFDRWGAQVYESNDPNEGWDGTYRGKLLDVGVYLYYIEFICPIDGSTQIKKGNVTLVR